MSKEVLKTLESVRGFMHVMNEFEEPSSSKHYFAEHFCIPACRSAERSSAGYRKVTKGDNCGGCFFLNISKNNVNKYMDNAINELTLLDILEVTDAG